MCLCTVPFPTQDLQDAEERVQSLERKRLGAIKIKMLSSTRAMLKSFHKNLNQRLADLLDDESFTWPELAGDASGAVEDDNEPEAKVVISKKTEVS